MPVIKTGYGIRKPRLAAEGLISHDLEALSSFQRDCTTRLGAVIQIEQEAYLSEHPEVLAMMKKFVAEMTREQKSLPQDKILQASAEYFTRPNEVLEEEVRQYLGLTLGQKYNETKLFHHQDEFGSLERELRTIGEKHFPLDFFDLKSSSVVTPETVSSTFVSIITSDTTLPTPEPISTPELTIYETLYQYISNACDKAIYMQVSDDILRYDTAYVELMHAVEQAMEIPVLGIRDDIAELFYNAYEMFEIVIREKERVAEEIAWQKRMRKKLKYSLRMMNNFRGYETPPTPKSTLSSHPSYLMPVQRPCECNPQFHYNRYPKDRFGRYVRQPEIFSNNNVTITPQFSVDSLIKKSEEEKVEEEIVAEEIEEEEMEEESLEEENIADIEQGEEKSVHNYETIV